MLGKKQVLASMLLIPLLMTGCGMANQVRADVIMQIQKMLTTEIR